MLLTDAAKEEEEEAHKEAQLTAAEEAEQKEASRLEANLIAAKEAEQKAMEEAARLKE